MTDVNDLIYSVEQENQSKTYGGKILKTSVKQLNKDIVWVITIEKK